MTGTGVHAGSASKQLCEAAVKHSSRLIVIATGPLTNVAHAVENDPQLISNSMCSFSFDSALRIRVVILQFSCMKSEPSIQH